MIILPCLSVFWTGGYLTYVFLLCFVFALIHKIVGGFRR